MYSLVYRHIKEALNLTGMQIHGNNMVTSSSLEHVGDELRTDGSTTLVLLILSSVWKVWHDGGDSSGGSRLASINHNQQFHQSIVDFAGRCRLKDKDVFVADALSDSDAGLEVGVLQDHYLGQFDAEPGDFMLAGFVFRSDKKNQRLGIGRGVVRIDIPFCYKLGQLWMRIARQELD